MQPLPENLTKLLDVAISDNANAIVGVANIARANAELDVARQKVADMTQAELDATAAAAQSEPAAIAAFKQFLHDQAAAKADSILNPPPVSAPTESPLAGN